MDEEEKIENKVVSLFGGSNLINVAIDEEDISASDLLERASKAGFDQMLILGAGSGDTGFITNIKTLPELVYLMERIKHYLVTVGVDDEE